MSLRNRLRSVGVSEARLKMLGIEAIAASAEPRQDGVNPAGVAHAADRQRARDLAEGAVSDIAAWRAYEAADPFTRSRMRQQNSAAIERGRELDTATEPEPAKPTSTELAAQAGEVLRMINNINNPKNDPPPPAAA